MKLNTMIKKIEKALRALEETWRKEPYLVIGLGLIAIEIFALLWWIKIIQPLAALGILFLTIKLLNSLGQKNILPVAQREQACLEALLQCKEILQTPCRCLEDLIPQVYTQWPQYFWDCGLQGEIPFLYLFLPHTAPQALPAETLEQEKRILQRTITRLLQGNQIAGLPITTIDGQTPILFLSDITDDGQMRRFSFAWLDNPEHIRRLREQLGNQHQKPPVPKNPPDGDF